MNCEEMMNIRQVRHGMKLRAGEEGMQRHIRWIYFADAAVEFTDKYKLADFIYGEELVIITNKRFTDDEDAFLEMLDGINRKNVAGVVIDEGNITPQMIRYCNEQKLPLFEMTLKIRMVDFSHLVCSALVEEESNANSRERILSSILFSSEIHSSDIREQAEHLDIDLSQRHMAVVVRLYDTEDHKASSMREPVQKLISNALMLFGLHHPLMLWQVNKSVLMLPADFFSRDLLVSILENIERQITTRCQTGVRIGIGSAYQEIEDLKKSYVEAKNALGILGNIHRDQNIFFYENLGIYSMIAQIDNPHFMTEYVKNTLGPLIKADQMQEGSLLGTLEAYLRNNCNANATAESLFIHKNTLRYRMDKIRRILDRDLDHIDQFLELELAFAILHYQENQNS